MRVTCDYTINETMIGNILNITIRRIGSAFQAQCTVPVSDQYKDSDTFEAILDQVFNNLKKSIINGTINTPLIKSERPYPKGLNKYPTTEIKSCLKCYYHDNPTQTCSNNKDLCISQSQFKPKMHSQTPSCVACEHHKKDVGCTSELVCTPRNSRFKRKVLNIKSQTIRSSLSNKNCDNCYFSEDGTPQCTEKCIDYNRWKAKDHHSKDTMCLKCVYGVERKMSEIIDESRSSFLDDRGNDSQKEEDPF